MSHSHGWQPALIFRLGGKRVRIKSSTYHVAIVICVELQGGKSCDCLLLIAKRYSEKDGNSVGESFCLFLFPPPFPCYTGITGGNLISKMAYSLCVSSFVRTEVLLLGRCNLRTESFLKTNTSLSNMLSSRCRMQTKETCSKKMWFMLHQKP